MPRIMTYNVHRCVGADGRLDLARIAAVIGEARPDIVALQELDVRRARTGVVDQAHAIAQRLGMGFHFNTALTVREERYGDAVLATAPLTVIKAGPLPGWAALPSLEPRGALWLELDLDGRRLQVLTTHLGLAPHEQRAQARALTGPDWIGARTPDDPPLLVLGDFNATPYAEAYRILARRLTPASRSRPTFPSRLPMLAIDHVFFDGAIAATQVETPTTPVARKASDHLPLVVDFAFT